VKKETWLNALFVAAIAVALVVFFIRGYVS